jgi:hypothetical protein
MEAEVILMTVALLSLATESEAIITLLSSAINGVAMAEAEVVSMKEAEVISMTVAMLSLATESEAIITLLSSAINGVFFERKRVLILLSIMLKESEKMLLVFGLRFKKDEKAKKRLLI